MKRLISLLTILTLFLYAFAQMQFATKSFSIFGTPELNDSVFIETNATTNNKKLIINNKIRSAVYNNEIQILPEIIDSIDIISEYVIDIFSSSFSGTNFIDNTCPKIKMTVNVSNDFVFSYELCKVEIQYVLGENQYNQHINTGGSSVANLAKPTALAKYYSLTNVLEGMENEYDIIVYLNSQYITSNQNLERFNINKNRAALENEFDLTTVLLRALVAGCGFHSEIKRDSNGLLSVRTNIGTEKYITIFDANVRDSQYNYLPHTYLDSLEEHDEVSAFLDNSQIEFYGQGLYNDYSATANNFNPIIANYLDFTEDNDDELMQAYLSPGVTIRSITPSTLNVLQFLGWRYDLAVGPTFPTKSIVSSDTLYSQTNYIFQLQNCGTGEFRIIMPSDEGGYELHRENILLPGFNPEFEYKLDTLPNMLWARDLSTGNAKAVISFTDENGTIEKDAYIPFRPNTPIISMDGMRANGMLFVTIHYSAYGATSFIVTRTDVDTNDIICDTISGSSHFTSYALFGTHNYEINIRAINNAGYTEIQKYIFNSATQGTWGIILRQVDQSIKITTVYNGSQIDYPITKSEVYTIGGQLLLTQNSSSKYVDVSSLARGIYVMKVTLQHGQIVSSNFAKR